MSSTIETKFVGNGADVFYKTLSEILPKKEHKVIAPNMVFTLPSQVMQGHLGLIPLRAGY